MVDILQDYPSFVPVCTRGSPEKSGPEVEEEENGGSRRNNLLYEPPAINEEK